MELLTMFIALFMLATSIHGCENTIKLNKIEKSCKNHKVFNVANREYKCIPTDKQIKLDELEKKRQEIMEEG